MFDWLLGKKSESQLGIDLGSYSIKVVELGKKEERAYLANYALAQAKGEAVFNVGELKEEEVAKILKDLLARADVSSRRANISLSVEKTFSTVISMPAMPEQELNAAVSFEAQKYVPVPLEEVVLDWTVISVESGQAKVGPKVTTDSIQGGAVGKAGAIEGVANIQVLLLAVPKETINRLTRIAKLAGLEVAALEQESFSLVRALVGNDKNTYMIIDCGRKGTDLIVVDQGFIKLSHNLESVNKEIILMEIDRIVNIFQMRYNRKVGQCLLAGGRAGGKDLLEFLSVKLRMPVKVGDPFARVSKGIVPDNILKELGPQFSVAVGLALREN